MDENNLNQRIYVIDHHGMIGSALELKKRGRENIVTRTRTPSEPDLTNQ